MLMSRLADVDGGVAGREGGQLLLEFVVVATQEGGKRVWRSRFEKKTRIRAGTGSETKNRNYDHSRKE